MFDYRWGEGGSQQAFSRRLPGRGSEPPSPDLNQPRVSPLLSEEKRACADRCTEARWVPEPGSGFPVCSLTRGALEKSAPHDSRDVLSRGWRGGENTSSGGVLGPEWDAKPSALPARRPPRTKTPRGLATASPASLSARGQRAGAAASPPPGAAPRSSLPPPPAQESGLPVPGASPSEAQGRGGGEACLKAGGSSLERARPSRKKGSEGATEQLSKLQLEPSREK